MKTWARCAVVVSTLLGTAGTANAELTSSEKGQIRDFVAAAKVENAGKVRSLVARTDLGPAESAEALAEAISPVAFTTERAGFVKELVFGGASNPSRPALTVIAVRALLARADVLHQKYPGGLDHEPKVIAELASIYAYLDTTIANAGKTTPTQHDTSSGIPMATFDESAAILKVHIDQNARWLKGDGALPLPLARLRAQAQLAYIDMLPDGLTRRVDAADRLTIKGARRAMLVDHGLLYADAGTADAPRLERIQKLLAKLKTGRNEVSAIYAGGDRGTPLRARGPVIELATTEEPWPFDGAAPASYDAASSAVAHELLVHVARRTLDARPAFRTQVEKDAAASAGDRRRLLGHPRAPSVVHALAAAMHALAIDAPRAMETANARAKEGRPETAALLTDAVGAFAETPTTPVELGKGGAWLPVTNLKLAPSGAAISFTVDGIPWKP